MVDVALRLLRIRPLRRSLLASAALLIGIGLLAIGVSGLLAAGADAIWGDKFVAGDRPGVTYTPARCAEFREYSSTDLSCEAAAASHHTDEVVAYRAATGIIGLVLVGGWLVARRRRPFAPLPPTLVPSIGAAVFGIAAVGLIVRGLDALLVAGGDGAGQWWSGGIAAGAVALWFAALLLDALATLPDTTMSS